MIERLRRELQESGRFQPTPHREQADAALRVRLIHGAQSPGRGDPGLGLSLELVDEDGAVLWSGGAAAVSWERAVEEAIGELVGQTR